MNCFHISPVTLLVYVMRPNLSSSSSHSFHVPSSSIRARLTMSSCRSTRSFCSASSLSRYLFASVKERSESRSSSLASFSTCCPLSNQMLALLAALSLALDPRAAISASCSFSRTSCSARCFLSASSRKKWLQGRVRVQIGQRIPPPSAPPSSPCSVLLVFSSSSSFLYRASRSRWSCSELTSLGTAEVSSPKSSLSSTTR